ncbi:MAG: thiamine ABC transporter substrate-binding protein [Chloroflexi bacterium]|nr:thiamine ABC transporter substrate-binding protein [Chloroflexota bacterium]MCC6893522.1 thiamine ABC transporter substrate-binding protein [Anaerolineae bacterium]
MKRVLFSVLMCVMAVAPVLAQEPTTITLVTHDSFAVSEDVLNAFQEETGITVQILKNGDAGAMVNQSILTKDNPLGDVLFGIDNTFLGRGLEADLFEPYESPLAADIPDAFKLDPENRVTPVDYGDVCLNYDVQYFEESGLALPESLADLTKPEYKSLLAVENPTSSSPGLAFLLATIQQFGEEGEYTYLNYWQDLVANDVYIADGWNDAYYTQFSASSGQGSRPLVVSYASSPPVEVYFADPQPETAPTGSIIADGTCFRQIEFVGILKGTANLEAAQQFVDFMVSQPFQEDLPLQMFVFPVNPEAELPDIFTKFAAVPENPALVDFAEINTNRESWLQAWTETVLR